jgi:hypothetical protein
MLYRETLEDRKYLKIHYILARKKLEEEYRSIQKSLGVPNMFSMGNMLLFTAAVIFFYVVSIFIN